MYGTSDVVRVFPSANNGATVYKETGHCSQLSFSWTIPGDVDSYFLVYPEVKIVFGNLIGV